MLRIRDGWVRITSVKVPTEKYGASAAQGEHRGKPRSACPIRRCIRQTELPKPVRQLQQGQKPLTQRTNSAQRVFRPSVKTRFPGRTRKRSCTLCLCPIKHYAPRSYIIISHFFKPLSWQLESQVHVLGPSPSFMKHEGERDKHCHPNLRSSQTTGSPTKYLHI